MLITTGARCVGELLINCSLQVLRMGRNNIGDDSITAIARALDKNRLEFWMQRYVVLLWWEQGIDFSSIIPFKNFITVEGARLILLSVVNNGVCERVSINNHNTSDNYESESEVQKMMTILQTRREANKR